MGSVGEVDEALFQVDKEQLKMKLQMRSSIPGNGGPGIASPASGPPSRSAHAVSAKKLEIGELRTVVRSLSERLDLTTNTLSKRVEDCVARTMSLVSRADSQHSNHQMAISELQQLIGRVNKVARAETSKLVDALREELSSDSSLAAPELGRSRTQVTPVLPAGIASQLNMIQTELVKCRDRADAAFDMSRRAQGSVDELGTLMRNEIDSLRRMIQTSFDNSTSLCKAVTDRMTELQATVREERTQ